MIYPGIYYFGPSPIERLEQQRKPDTTTTPKKPKPVTDEQLLAIVEELNEKIRTLAKVTETIAKSQYRDNDRLLRLRELGFFGRMFSSKWWGV